MTVLYVDSFDHYATSELQEKDYSTNAGPIEHTIVGTGRRGTSCLSSQVAPGKFGLVMVKSEPCGSSHAAISSVKGFSLQYQSLIAIQPPGLRTR